MRDPDKAYADSMGKIQIHKKITTRIWSAKDILQGPTNAVIEKTAIDDPMTRSNKEAFEQTKKQCRRQLLNITSKC